MNHELKIHEQFFEETRDGSMPFTVRRNDRNFQVGDLIVFREWYAVRQQFTGRAFTKKITFALDGGRYGIEEKFVVLGLCDIGAISGKVAVPMLEVSAEECTTLCKGLLDCIMHGTRPGPCKAEFRLILKIANFALGRHGVDVWGR